jgi:hypothetical protein
MSGQASRGGGRGGARVADQLAGRSTVGERGAGEGGVVGAGDGRATKVGGAVKSSGTSLFSRRKSDELEAAERGAPPTAHRAATTTTTETSMREGVALHWPPGREGGVEGGVVGGCRGATAL